MGGIKRKTLQAEKSRQRRAHKVLQLLDWTVLQHARCASRQRNRSSRSSSQAQKVSVFSQTLKRMVEYHDGDGDWIYQIPEAPTFFPTQEEFEDPIRYIQKIQGEACRFGKLCYCASPTLLLLSVKPAEECFCKDSGA